MKQIIVLLFIIALGIYLGTHYLTGDDPNSFKKQGEQIVNRSNAIITNNMPSTTP